MINNITEDYVSFEIAKLLKEKGFDNPSKYNFYYESLNPEQKIQCFGILYKNHNLILAAPTHALAIKWIRENFGIHICIRVSNVKYNILITNPLGDILFNDNAIDTNEKATHVAILYTLQNLIP